MKRLHQLRLGFGKGRDTGQDEATERNRKRAGDGEEWGGAGTHQRWPG